MSKTLLMAKRLFTLVQNPSEYLRDRQGWLKTPTMHLKLRNGLTIILRSGTSDRCVFNDLWLERAYDLPGLQYEKYRSIIDIGAHIGLYALFAADASPKAQIYAFEPESENFALLQKNIDNNHLSDRIHAFAKGIGAKEGTLQLNVMPGRGECNSSYRQMEESFSLQVPVTTLENIFRSENIDYCDLLKVNCEGEEYNIFLSMPDSLFDSIGAIILNYHLFSPDPAKHPRVLKQRLEERGFTVSRHLRNFFLAQHS